MVGLALALATAEQRRALALLSPLALALPLWPQQILPLQNL
jgi:hypothetical protein